VGYTGAVRRAERHRIAAATWRAPAAGPLYGRVELDAGAALDYLRDLSTAIGSRATMTHLVGKAVGMALVAAPDLNARIVLGRLRPLPSVDVAFVVATRDGGDLSSVRVRSVDEASLGDIATLLNERAAPVRVGDDVDFGRSSGIMARIPFPLTRPAMWAAGFVQSGLGKGIPALGLKPDGFGGAMVSNVSAFGVEQGFGALIPFTRVGALVLVGAVTDRPVARDGQVVVRPMVDLGITLDHRLVDGAQLGPAIAALRHVVEHPVDALGPVAAAGHLPRTASIG
jgi:pyruvate dehydrogenase E2 component (dihydrolipoamide acetyltransferase)